MNLGPYQSQFRALLFATLNSKLFSGKGARPINILASGKSWSMSCPKCVLKKTFVCCTSFYSLGSWGLAMTIFLGGINYCNLLIIIIISLFTCPYFFVCVGVSVNFFLPMVNLTHNCICTLTIVRMHVKIRLRMKLLWGSKWHSDQHKKSAGKRELLILLYMYASFVLFYADFAAVNMLALVLSS